MAFDENKTQQNEVIDAEPVYEEKAKARKSANGEKARIIQEYVPGKQVTMAHVIANPDRSLYKKLGLADERGALGIFTITPGEAAIIASDVATKAANVSICFVDRFNGALVITGDVAAVNAAMTEVISVLSTILGFTPAIITRT